MTKEDKLYEVYGSRYDWDENGWLTYGCDEASESGFEPFGEYETRNHIDGYYEWRPIELQGIEDNNGWIKIESIDNLPEKSTLCFCYNEMGHIFTTKLFKSNTNYSYVKLENITHYQPITKPEPPIY
jgi:hypothetical protein